MRDHQPCGRSGCSESGIAAFGAGTLCSEHFLVACYEALGRMDRGMGLSARGATEAREAKRVAKECERGVLEVSLRAGGLSNLQKARLLDILLWASDELHRDSCPQVKASGNRPVQEPNLRAEEKVRRTERETAAVAIGHQQDDDPLRTLQDVEETLKSQRSQAAVSDARGK